jgi:polysaccharide biosynthesis transport protein
VGPYLDDRARHDEWSLAECLRTLYRRKATVIGLTCLGILAAAAITAVQPRTYRSSASLEIQAFNESFLDLRDVYSTTVPSGDTATYIQTQSEILQQDNLLKQVASRLHLDSRPEFRSPRGLIPRLRQDVRIVPVKNSRIIQIVCDAQSPLLAADLANTLAEVSIEQSTRERQEVAQQTYQSLITQLEELRRTLHIREGKTTDTLSAPNGDVNRRVYDAMLQKAYYAWFASRLPTSNYKLVGAASPPMAAYRPNLRLNLAIGLIGGLLLAFGFVMLQEQHKSVLRLPGEAGTYLELPELGAIPQANSWTAATIFSGHASHAKFRIERIALEQRAGLAEAFRATVASMLSPGSNGGLPHVLVVTSSRPMEGKTTIVSNLGIALAAISQKVLLIDGDMRRPRLHKLFDQANSWGLSDVLREKNAIDELPLDVLAKKTSVPHLYLLPSGASTDNIFGLLYSGRMSRLLPRFREEFDYILVDAPPCLEFADARIMARYAEELLLVVRANHTDRRTVQAAVRRLRLDGIALMGIILNRWNPSPGDPYYYSGGRSLVRQGLS